MRKFTCVQDKQRSIISWPNLVLLGVEFDDKSLLDRHGDLFPVRQSFYRRLIVILVELNPAWRSSPDHGLDIFIDQGIGAALLFQADDIANRYQKGGDVDFPPVDQNVIVADELSCLIPGGSKADTKHGVVQPTLEHNQQVFTGDTPLLLGLLKKETELLFEHAVHALNLLLLTQLNGVVRLLFKSRLAMLARTESPSLERTFIRKTTIAFVIEL